jgi:hypothetical protein
MKRFRRIFGIGLICLPVILSWACREKENGAYPAAAFKPVIGALTGGPIQGRLDITVLDDRFAKPLKDAEVYVHQGRPMRETARAATDADGHVRFEGMNGPVTVTVVCETEEAYDTITWMDLDAADVVIPMTLRKNPRKVSVASTS